MTEYFLVSFNDSICSPTKLKKVMHDRFYPIGFWVPDEINDDGRRELKIREDNMAIEFGVLNTCLMREFAKGFLLGLELPK